MTPAEEPGRPNVWQKRITWDDKLKTNSVGVYICRLRRAHNQHLITEASGLKINKMLEKQDHVQPGSPGQIVCLVNDVDMHVLRLRKAHNGSRCPGQTGQHWKPPCSDWSSMRQARVPPKPSGIAGHRPQSWGFLHSPVKSLVTAFNSQSQPRICG